RAAGKSAREPKIRSPKAAAAPRNAQTENAPQLLMDEFLRNMARRLMSGTFGPSRYTQPSSPIPEPAAIRAEPRMGGSASSARLKPRSSAGKCDPAGSRRTVRRRTSFDDFRWEHI